MSFTDLITIAIPCYERKQYFLEALESAINQTVRCEIIVVDNCSSHDYFEKVCNEKGIKYFRNECNIGLYRNINRCFELANTEYAKILDDDDLLLPNYIESFLKALEESPNIDVFFSNYSILKLGKVKPHDFNFPFGYMENGKEIIEYGIKYKIGFPYMTSAFKKTKIHTEGEITEYSFGFDWEWIYTTADLLSFYGNPQELYKYRVHGNQSSSSNWIYHLLTVPYIYDMILANKTSDPKLLRKVSRNSFNELLYLKSKSDKKELDNVIEGNNKYSLYLRTKLDNNYLLKIYFILPDKLARAVYKGLNIVKRLWKRSPIIAK